MTNNKILLLGSRRFIIFLATALFFSFASCVSENCLLPEPTPADGAERAVSLRLAQPTATTRGVSRPICDGEPVQFNQGTLYLVNLTGAIVRHFTILDRDAPLPAPLTVVNGITTGGSIRIDQLEDGKDIGLVPGNVTRVVLVGNSQVALPASGNISSVISGTSGLVRNTTNNTIATQHDAFFNPGVNMFADATLVRRRTDDGTPTGTPTVYPAGLPVYDAEGYAVWGTDMILAPTVARFEIAQMTGMGNIESFQVAGIFIDRYHRQATRDGSFYPNATASLVNHGEESARFAVNTTNHTNNRYIAMAPAVGARTSGALFTIYNPALASDARNNDGVRARPIETHTWPTGETCLVGCCAAGSTVNQVWSFQMFAQDFVRPITSSTPAPSTTPPIIVVRLNNVYIRTGFGETPRNIGTQYLTIASFYRRDTGSTGALTQLGGIRASNVYHIANLTFDEQDLYIRPNVRNRNATVEVDMAVWNSGDLRPGVFRQPNPMGDDLGQVPVDPGYILHSISLGPAFHGRCATITYLWQRSIVPNPNPANPAHWTPAIDVAESSPVYDLTAKMWSTTYFRRIAFACGEYIISAPARVQAIPPPPTPVPTGYLASAFVSVMYDFQRQRFYALTNNTDPLSFQWQVSIVDPATATEADWRNITSAGAAGTSATMTRISNTSTYYATWLIPGDFIHRPHLNIEGESEGSTLFNNVDELFFRTRFETQAGLRTQEPANTLRILFVRTTEDGSLTPTGALRPENQINWRQGFGIYQGVRYARMNRTRHMNNLSNPNTIRVALLNIGATDYCGGLGQIFHWGRRADGHQNIGWAKTQAGNNAMDSQANTTASAIPGRVTSDAVPRGTNALTVPWINTATGQVNPLTQQYGRFILVTTSPWTWTNHNANLRQHMWGNLGSVNNRTTAPLNIDQWHENARPNNPCPPGWYIPSAFDWSDLVTSSGTSTGFQSGTAGYTNWSAGTPNMVEFRPARAGAAGAIILRTPDNVINQNNAASAVVLSGHGLRRENNTVSGANTVHLWSSTSNAMDMIAIMESTITTSRIAPRHGVDARVGAVIRCVAH